MSHACILSPQGQKNYCKFKDGLIYRVRSKLESLKRVRHSLEREQNKTVCKIPILRRITRLRLTWAKYIT